MNSNEILITISEDKKKITVSTVYREMTFDACPNNVLENIPNAIKSYVEKTGLDGIPQFSNIDNCSQNCNHC